MRAPKSKFLDASQGSTLQMGLSKDSDLKLASLTLVCSVYIVAF